jgi:hypothetical protein
VLRILTTKKYDPSWYHNYLLLLNCDIRYYTKDLYACARDVKIALENIDVRRIAN